MTCDEEPPARCTVSGGAALPLPLSYCNMFTCFWHFWSWLEPPVTSPLASPAVITMASIKKGYGSPTRRANSQLRSPVVKRPLAAPVTMQGWLHKQGSEGLMLWKKRWFVLSEYCLFYYKTSEEEKLLGSILLPSYKISPCGVEDKIYRKFSFKAEHANMRTYYFAADSQQLMAQWMNALSLASILQESSSWEEHKSNSSHQRNLSADDSDSGFHGHSRPTNDSLTDCATPSNGWRPPVQGFQPLYANAPPKPRRLNNDTSSPERSPERASDDGRLSNIAQPQDYPMKSERAYNYTAQHSHRPPLMLPSNSQPQERRTPDTYGRSNSTNSQTGKVISSKPRTLDYEDVYQTNPELVNVMYSQNNMYSNQPVQYRQNRRSDISRNVPLPDQKRLPPRPHSADFLEFDAKRSYQSPTPQSSDSGNLVYYNQRNLSQPRRPKSSLDIVHTETGVDGTHWSEESYARKMRQSASYVSPQLQNFSNSSRATTPSVRQVPVMHPGYYNGQVNGDLSSVTMRQHSEAIHAQERRWSEYVDRTNGQFVRSASARLARHGNDERMEDDGSDKSYQSSFRRRNSTDNRDSAIKSHQREESMKRLLEWKQRMLQSPLTRKSSGSSSRGTAQNQLSQYYQHQTHTLRELNSQPPNRSRATSNEVQANPNAWQRDGWDKDMLEHARMARRKHSDAGRSRSQDGRRSAASVYRYNSYSSDDEEPGSTRECRKRVRRSSRDATRSRVNSLERKSTRSTPTPLSFPDYENVTLGNTPPNKDHLKGCNQSRHLPDLDLMNMYRDKSNENKVDLNFSIKLPQIKDDHRPGESFDSGNTLAESSILGNEDRFTISSKHSDSGYDTLQTGGLLPVDPEVSDLLKFRFDKRNSPHQVVAYPVHTKSGKPFDNWGEKIDESRLIKEFSYQYIKSNKNDGKNIEDDKDKNSSKVLLTKRFETPPQNIVQNRIKAFETTKEDDISNAVSNKDPKLKMQEPLKVSPSAYQPNEAHVSSIRTVENKRESPMKTEEEMSNLRRSRRTSLHGFALGDAISMLDEEAKYAKRENLTNGKNLKSVKDLLADFERKSQLAHEQLAAEEKSGEDFSGKRYVLSDTETLLYDTSSDAEENKNDAGLLKSNRSELAVSEDDEERDDEVAAVLGQKGSFKSSCRDLSVVQGSNINITKSTKRKQIEERSPGERLFVSEFMQQGDLAGQCDDFGSHSSTPRTEKNKLDESKSVLSTSPPEQHYMPMTPSKKLTPLAPANDVFAHTRSGSASQSFTSENVGEESSYVEMTNGNIRSLLAPNSSNEQNSNILTDSQNYCEIRSDEDSAHYEFLYKASSTTAEPLYMEVSPLLEQEQTDPNNASFKENSPSVKREETEGAEQPPTPPKTSLPDILNSSTCNNKNTPSIKSDSSDADDEASKDLDSLDTPRHPRFSLSDTFRPASYYLGASVGERTLIGMTSEHPDSSDSDLVSPPPIPTSPPPLDDLDTSLESSIDVKKISPVQIKSESVKFDMEGKESSRKLWNPTPLLGKDMRRLQERIESLNLTPILDDALSSETDSIDSSKRDRLLKRRPVSADILNSLQAPDFIHSPSFIAKHSGGSDLDSIGSRNGLAMHLEDNEGIDFDQYLEDLHTNKNLAPKLPLKDPKLDYRMYEKPKYDTQNVPSMVRMTEMSSYTPDGSSSNESRIKYNLHQSAPNQSDEVHYENVQGLFPPPPSAEFLQELSSENDTTIRYSSPEVGVRSSPVVLVENHNIRDINLQAGAPYYYSDLLKEEQANEVNNRTNIPRSVRIQQLNNQRDGGNCTEINLLNKRNDIGRRVNAIKQILPGQVIDKDEAAKLAEELRTTSVHFLGAADKVGHVDERNLYEADTLQRRKAVTLMEQRFRSQTPDLRNSARNLYPQGIRDKNDITHGQDRQPQRRSRSLEGLLDEPELTETEQRQNRLSPGNAISRLLQTTQPQQSTSRSPLPAISVTNAQQSSSRSRAPPPPPDVWEEDALWRESLRRVSIRHTRSLDDLDRNSLRDVAASDNRKVSREVTYVNESVAMRPRTNHREYEEDYREGRSLRQVRAPIETEVDDGVHYERLVPRDGLSLDQSRRQTYIEGYVWDEEREMFCRGEKKSLPIRDPPRKPSQPFLEVGLYPTRPPSFEIDREKLRQWDLMSSAPAGMLGAGGGGGGGVVPKRVGESVPPVNHPDNTPPSSPASGSGSVIGRDPLPPRQVVVSPPVVEKPPPPSLSPTSHNPDLIHHKRPERGWSLQLSAGELLGRTHEELVLLLIQLRRQSAGFCKAMEACHMEIEAQARLVELETPKRMEHLQKLEDLKRHLLELEKQYEKGKPLVNLVDNMVKLGSLYRVGAPLPGATPLLRERLEFNHLVQERRLLAEERRDWERLSPDHNQLQAKVEQLYRLDRLLQEESGTLQTLQQDKEMLERALGGLRHKLQAVGGNPAQAEKYRRQQRLLERELSRVRSILAHNSKKLEETVAENARLEQELVVLRQKLVWSRRVPDQSVTSTTQLEAELSRVQSLVGDLQRQRLELSSQVRQLTERSNSLSQQIRPSPTGVQGVGAVGSKKTLSSSWLETDLDTQVTQDVGQEPVLRSPSQNAPLYVNTDLSKAINGCSTYEGVMSQDDLTEVSVPTLPHPGPTLPPPTSQPAQYTRPMDISEADDRIKRFYGIIPRDKPQEIKTVRIVKRESERRQRDRDRSGNIGIPLTNTSAKRVTIIEETVPAESVDRGLSRLVEELPEPPSEVLGGSLAPKVPPAPGPRSDSVQALRNLVSRQRARVDSESTSPSHSVSAHEQLFGSSDTLLSPQLSPSYQSQLSPVYQSQAARQIVEEMAHNNRRTVPREKRRHHTVSGRPLLRIDTSYSAGGSRDDLDMERALRPRLNTPDVVRSTLSRSEVKYNSDTIDSILGTPGKILIPERYVPESTPELTSEEQQRRNKKAESIRKMLSETTQISAPDDNNEAVEEEEKSSTLKKKVAEEKRQREHLLQLNQILAQQVMEKSKMVAVRALATLPLSTDLTDESDLSSPEEPLPLYQQRDNYFS